MSCGAVGAWPAYRPEARAVMELGDRVGLLDDPSAATRRQWDEVR